MNANQIMTLEEVADYLRVSERTVYNWVKEGKIPCGKIGGVWRFRRDLVEKWVNGRLNQLSNDVTDFSLPIKNVLTADRVMLLESISKQELLERMVKLLAELPIVEDEDDLMRGIFNREALMSTGIGMGIGVPHVRLNTIDDIAMAVAVCRQGISDYESLDSIPVQIVFMIIARKDQHAGHLKLLSTISTRLKDDLYREKLLAVPNTAELYRLLTEAGK
jgi:PTS system nitrogen regulatory IIA component